MPRGRPRKTAVVHMLQANEPVAAAGTIDSPKPSNFLTESEIMDAMQPYVAKGVKVEISDTHWTLTLHKEVRDIRGKVIGGGPCKCTGTRAMPTKDLIYSANELMIPINPITPNPTAA